MNTSKKLICFILFILTILCLPVVAFSANDEEIVVIACSDFQPPKGLYDGSLIVSSILQNIKNDGVTNADGFLCCGDYDYSSYGNVSNNKAGIQILKRSLYEFVNEENMVFVQGNHDASVDADVGLSPSGNNDRADGAYGVYVIHNEDYMWGNSDESRIKLTAQKLINYLNNKLEDGYDRPIFVVSHLPLHYTMRTAYDGDGKYAAYIFDALNEAAAKGLNIIFMYGHDHSNGWDDYLGGAAVYLAKGDKILIADKSQTIKSYKTLNFTYLNAGFIGYYEDLNGGDATLTMTVFKIKGDKVTVARYSQDGVYNLKSAGVKNAYKNESGYDPNITVYNSPQNINLTNVSDNSHLENIMDISNSGMRLEKVTDLSKLYDGGKYLLVYNSSSDYIMIPKVVSKGNSSGKRTGFDIISTTGFGDTIVFAELDESYVWTFTKGTDGWYIGDGDNNAVFECSSDEKIKAKLEGGGNQFKIEGASGAFTFASDSYVLNYNSRGLINGYEGSPASFYIYECCGYSIDVKYGNADVNGIDATVAKSGETVVVTAKEAPEGKIFDKWLVIEGNITFEDIGSECTSFVMSSSSVKIEATYKNIKIEDTTNQETILDITEENSSTEESLPIVDTGSPETTPKEIDTESVVSEYNDDNKSTRIFIIFGVCIFMVIVVISGSFIAKRKIK